MPRPHHLERLRLDEQGLSVIEYALLGLFVAIAALGALSLLRPLVATLFG